MNGRSRFGLYWFSFTFQIQTPKNSYKLFFLFTRHHDTKYRISQALTKTTTSLKKKQESTSKLNYQIHPSMQQNRLRSAGKLAFSALFHKQAGLRIYFPTTSKIIIVQKTFKFGLSSAILHIWALSAILLGLSIDLFEIRQFIQDPTIFDGLFQLQPPIPLDL